MGFKTLIKPDIVLNIQDALSINFTLPVGAVFETVTVEGWRVDDQFNRCVGQHGGRSNVRGKHAAEWAQLPGLDFAHTGNRDEQSPTDGSRWANRRIQREWTTHRCRTITRWMV